MQLPDRLTSRTPLFAGGAQRAGAEWGAYSPGLAGAG